MSNTQPDGREYQIDKAIAEYLQLKAAGATPDRAEWLALHPDFSEELAEFLDDMQIVEREIPAAQPPDTENQDDLRMVHLLEGKLVANKYLLESRLGAGGMGEVWVARQSQPVRRRVAIKFIRVGLESRAAQTRFEAERQALAIMDHPNIAKVFDGGVTHEGNPFITMELVNGIPLDKYCDDASLSPSERVDLFVQVCLGVQHAHQKGIVHRDLKPSNILVTMYDGKPVPKIIDFGVAKATGGKLSDESFLTGFGAIVGTLEYMSPEQAGASAQDIDTRADIYSLGVILYELLTGLRPIDSQRLRAAAFAEMLRLIREEDPPRPSTRLSSDQSLALHAARRHVEPRKLMSILRGELDWIVMKCLEKDRNRRYASANGLAVDLQRFLTGDAVEARPPSAWYRITKFSRKHRGFVMGSSLLLLSLVLGLASTSWAMVRARAAESEANRQRNRAVAVCDFLTEDLLGQASPELNPRADKVTVEQLLDRAAAELTATEVLGDNLEAKAELFAVIADTYEDLGEYSKASENWTHALELNSRLNDDGRENRILDAKQGRASALLELNRYAESEQILQEVIAQRLKIGEADNDQLLFAQNNLAIAMAHQGRFEEAIQLLSDTWEIRRQSYGATHPDTLQVVSNLAGMYMATGNYARAEELFRSASSGYQESGKQDSPNAMACENGLVTNLIHQRRLAEAKELLQQLVTRRTRILGADHSETLGSRTNLAYVLSELGDNEGSVRESKEVYEAFLDKHGESYHETLSAKNVLALALRKARRFDEAIAFGKELVATVSNTSDVDSRVLVIFQNNLAWMLEGKGEYLQAESVYRNAIDAAAKAGLGDIPEAINANHSLARVYFLQKKYSEGAGSRTICFGAARRRALPPGHPDILATFRAVVDSLIELDRAEEAEEMIEATLKSDTSLPESTKADLLYRLGRCQFLVDNFQASIESLEAAIQIRKDTGSEPWQIGQIRSLLGEALSAASRYDDAELALKTAAEELMTGPETMPNRQELIDRNASRLNDVQGKKATQRE